MPRIVELRRSLPRHRAAGLCVVGCAGLCLALAPLPHTAPVPVSGAGAADACVTAPSAARLELVGSAGGALQALAVFGDTAYAGQGARLTVLDVADPAAVREIGRTPPLGGPVRAVHVAGAYAFAAVEGVGLVVAAVSDSTAPRAVATLSLPGGAHAVAATGRHVLVAGRGWHVVDVERPDKPHLLDSLDVQQPVAAIAADGRRVVVGRPDGVLSTHLLDDQGGAAFLAERPIGSTIQSMTLDPGIAFVAGASTEDPSAGRFTVVDVDPPGDPTVLAAVPLTGPALAVAARRRHAYVLTAEPALHVVDVRSPGAPVPGQAVPLSGIPTTGASTPSRLLAGVGDVLVGWDLADPALPGDLGATPVAWPAVGAGLAGGRAFVAAGRSGVRALDLTDPAAPTVVGVWSPDGGEAVVDVAAAGGRLLAAAGEGGVLEFDLTGEGLGAPTRHWPSEARPVRRVVARGERAYAIAGDHDLWILQRVDGAWDRAVLTLPFPAGEGERHRVTDVAAEGSTVFLATAGAGFFVVDAAVAGQPRVVGAGAGGGDRLALAGSALLTIRETQDLRVFDVASPAAPRQVGTLVDAAWTFTAIATDGGRAYVVAERDGAAREGAPPFVELWTVDAANPAAPRALARTPLPAPAGALAAGDGAVLVPSGPAGLVLARADAGAAPRPETCRAFLPALANGGAPPKPLTARRVWEWASALADAEQVDLRAGDWDGDAVDELILAGPGHLLELRRGDGGRLLPAWHAERTGVAWGLDDVDGDGRPDAWSVDAMGSVGVFRPDRAVAAPLGQLELGADMTVRAAVVADVYGNGSPSLVALLAPLPADPPRPPTERWVVRVWSLPALVPGLRVSVAGVPPGLDDPSLVVGQVDEDSAGEIILSFPGARRRPEFPHGWVIDPLAGGAQWTRPDGFGDPVIVADADGDGRAEIIGALAVAGNATVAFDATTGTEKWRLPFRARRLLAADVAGDAATEIVAAFDRSTGVGVFDGRTLEQVRGAELPGWVRGMTATDPGSADGRALVFFTAQSFEQPPRLQLWPSDADAPVDALPPHGGSYRPIVARLDGSDAPPSVVVFPMGLFPVDDLASHLVLDGLTGRERVRPGLALTLGGGASDRPRAPLAANVDADPLPEILFASGETLHVFDDDGSLLRVLDLSNATPRFHAMTPAWAGDVDGDLEPEVVLTGGRVLVVRLDRSDSWAVPAGGSEAPQARVADLDADGVPELVTYGRGSDVTVWDTRRRDVAWSLPGTAWSVDSVAAARVDPAEGPRLALVRDGRVTYVIGPDHREAPGPDLWRGANHVTFARLLDTAFPQLVSTSDDAIYVHHHPDDADPALVIWTGDPTLGSLEAADVDGDGRPEILAGFETAVRAYAVDGDSAGAP